MYRSQNSVVNRNMSDKYHVVPWINSEEWNIAYSYIYTETSKRESALDILQIWKARCPALPSGIESTFSLLQVHVQDVKWESDLANDQILRLAYCSALMRFVNHMLDTETAKGTSLYIAARNLGIPDWIVELRHDTAHNNNLPSLVLLRNACSLCLNWLQINYWDKYKKSIADYTSDLGQSSSDENKIAALMHFCTCLSVCSHSKIKKLSDITDASMQEAIVNDARDLFGNQIDLSNLKTVSTASLINMINLHAKKMLKNSDTASLVNKALLGEDSLFLSLELLDYLCNKNDFNKKKRLSRNYVMCFEVLLTFLHTNDLIYDFIMSLIKITQSDDCSTKSMLAALWISEILSALRKSKQFMERANKIQSESLSSKKKDLKMLYHHWFPNEKLDGYVLDLQKPVPIKLTDINTIQPIISSYNAYLTYFVKDLLNLVEPHLPKQVSEKICKLARLISTPDKFPAQFTSDKIYTIEDLKFEGSPMKEDIYDSADIQDPSQKNIQEQQVTGIWKIAAKHNWATCPIGIVPWQQSPEVAI